MRVNHRYAALSSTTQAILLMAEESSAVVAFRSLPYEVQKHVLERIDFMRSEENAITNFDKELVSLNPAPVGVSNHWAWRATSPISVTLKIPVSSLECDLVWAAYPTRDLSRVDVHSIALQLRAAGGASNLIEYVGQAGVAGLRTLISHTISRIS